ncbi:MAG: hypothetical protein M9925_11965 [Chloroflexi bacterium]|nr:hypothetical protein [Chloroflexota bacterium]MCZ7576968.1 hypothetical protein [Dehalococcoidia bacterium]
MDDQTPESSTTRESTQERRRPQQFAAIERAKELVQRYVEGTPSIADALLAERRAEAEK